MFSKWKKRWWAVITMVAAMVMCFSLPVLAADKSYEIEYVNFYVSFDENGNAYVTEDWKVTYDGSFTRLYKDIHYADLPIVEQFDDMLLTSISINGVQASRSENRDDRPANTYCFTEDGENYTVQWNYPVTDATVEYSVTYILQNVVTVTDENRAIFCYRFIGNNFDHSIQQSTIHFINPTDENIIVKFTNRDMEASQDASSLTLTTDSYSGLCKVNVNMDGTFFANAGKKVAAETIAAEEKKEADAEAAEDALFGGICAVVGFGGIAGLIALIRSGRKEKKLKERAKDSQDVWQQIQLLQRERISPTYLLLRYRETSGICNTKAFLSQIMYLILEGYIQYNKEEDTLVFLSEQQIGTPIADIDLQFFTQLREMVGKTVITRQDIEEQKEYYVSQFEKYFASYAYKYSISKEAAEAVKIVKYAGLEMNAIPEFDAEHLDYMYIVKQGLLHEVSGEEGEYYSIIDMLDYYACYDYVLLSTQEKEASSSSSGSSCSSCSSCSGCGGGGAD